MIWWDICANALVLELPGYTAGAGYRILEVLLGRVPTLGTVSSATSVLAA